MTKDLDEFFDLLGTETIHSLDPSTLRFYLSLTIIQLRRMRNEPGTTDLAKKEIDIVISAKKGIRAANPVEEACDSA